MHMRSLIRSSNIISKKTSSLFLIIIAINSLLYTRHVGSSPSKFSWLEIGSYATYSISPEMDQIAQFGFDDYAFTDHIIGNYSWRCIELNASHAKLELELDFTVPENGSVKYTGREFVNRAEEGDFSFIKRIAMDQIKQSKIELLSEDLYLVLIWGPIQIYKKLIVTIDLNTLELINENGKPWGKWAMWIDSLKYPLVGKFRETFIMNWLNTTVDLYVGYNNGTLGPPIDIMLGRFEKYFAAGAPPVENDFLLKLGIGMTPSAILLTYVYETRSGVLLQSATDMYLDDVLTQKLGAIFTSGAFTLLETKVPIEQSTAFDLSPYVPYLAILTISATITGAYLIKKKKLSTHTQSKKKRRRLSF